MDTANVIDVTAEVVNPAVEATMRPNVHTFVRGGNVNANAETISIDNINKFFDKVNTRNTEDYVVNTAGLRMDNLNIIDGDREIQTTPFFRNQFYTKLANGMKGLGDYLEDKNVPLLNRTVNDLLKMQPADKHNLVRMADNNARAFLSTRYKAIDDPFVFGNMQERMGNGEFNFLKAHVSMNMTSVKMISKQPFMELGKRHLYYGYMAKNSEVGTGYMQMICFICDGYCMNGVIISSREIFTLKMKHMGERIPHIGKVHLELDQYDRDNISKQIVMAMDSAVTVPNHGLGEKLQFSFNKQITGDMRQATAEVLKRFKLNLSLDEVMKHAEPEERSVYGVQASLTSLAQSIPNYETQLKIEEVAGQMIDDVANIYPILEQASLSKIA